MINCSATLRGSKYNWIKSLSASSCAIDFASFKLIFWSKTNFRQFETDMARAKKFQSITSVLWCNEMAGSLYAFVISRQRKAESSPGGGVLPMMDCMERPLPKGLPLSGWNFFFGLSARERINQSKKPYRFGNRSWCNQQCYGHHMFAMLTAQWPSESQLPHNITDYVIPLEVKSRQKLWQVFTGRLNTFEDSPYFISDVRLRVRVRVWGSLVP